MDEGCCFLSPLRHEVRGYFSGPDRTFAPFNFGGVPPLRALVDSSASRTMGFLLMRLARSASRSAVVCW